MIVLTLMYCFMSQRILQGLQKESTTEVESLLDLSSSANPFGLGVGEEKKYL